jgi:NAD(P)-dependent dehydrogenase (short-subunit alcohol dehydrogenase family)
MANDKNRPTCLITGATDGVGKATATELARAGYAVTIAARSESKAKAVAADIAATTGGLVDYLVADLSSLAQTHSLADRYLRRVSRLDVLVNNAGVFLPKRTVTGDGFETTYQVNYLSHFLLSHRLLDALKESRQGRIINLSSSVYAMGKFEPDNLQSERRFSTLRTYASSKLYMLMFTKELAERLRSTRVTANAVHPGIVRTSMMLNAPGAFKLLSYLSFPFSISSTKGARTTIHLATSDSLAGTSGTYFVRSKPRLTKNAFDTEENRARLWNLSLEQTRTRSTQLAS